MHDDLDSSKLDFQYEYHWHRIIGVGLILVVLVLAAVLFFDDEQPAGDAASGNVDAPASKILPVLESERPAVMDKAETPGASATTDQQSSASTPEDGSASSAQARPGSDESTLDAEPDDDPAGDARWQTVAVSDVIANPNVLSNDASQGDVAASATDDEAVDEAQQQEEAQQKAVATEPQPAAVEARALQSPHISIHSDHVKVLRFAVDVVNMQPVGAIDELVWDSKGFTNLYLFSDIVGLNDSYFDYIWYRNDVQVAVVSVGIRSDRWRSYARKLISTQMTGHWRIELKTRQGELLGEASFDNLQ